MRSRISMDRIAEKEIDLQEAEDFIPADPEVTDFSYTIKDGTIYFRENSRMYPARLSETAAKRAEGLIGIRTSVRRLIELQTDGYPDEEIRKEQENLSSIYDAFTKEYGLINSRANSTVFSQDSSYYLLAALEVIDENGKLVRKADMFTKRTIKPHEAVQHCDTASEALAVSMGEKGHVDMEYMMQLTGISEDKIAEALSGVIFYDPKQDPGSGTGRYLAADEYLSGNVREKLKEAEALAGADPRFLIHRNYPRTGAAEGAFCGRDQCEAWSIVAAAGCGIGLHVRAFEHAFLYAVEDQCTVFCPYRRVEHRRKEQRPGQCQGGQHLWQQQDECI